MENILIFLRDNWKFLVEILVPLVSLVILCLVRKTKINIPSGVVNVMWTMIPTWIKDAEIVFGAGHGDEKLKFVIKTACDFISNECGLSNKSICDIYANGIIEQVEAILSTPKKKEKE